MPFLSPALQLNLDTTGQDYPMLAGNLVALFWSAIVCTVLSYIWPQVGLMGLMGRISRHTCASIRASLAAAEGGGPAPLGPARWCA